MSRAPSPATAKLPPNSGRPRTFGPSSCGLHGRFYPESAGSWTDNATFRILDQFVMKYGGLEPRQRILNDKIGILFHKGAPLQSAGGMSCRRRRLYPAEPDEMAGDPIGTVGRVRGLERCRGGKHGRGPGPGGNPGSRGRRRGCRRPRPGASGRGAELGEAPAGGIDDRRAAGHRLADGPVAGLGHQGVGRGDQVAAVPFRGGHEVQVLEAADRRGVIADEVDSLWRRTSPAAPSRGRVWPYRPM